MKEFGLIERYFTWKTDDVSIAQGVGDDCALIDIDSNARIVTTVDTFIEDVHFAKNTPARAIAHKALAVNLSDLAAMGAKPWYFTLAITLPSINHDWLEEFSSSLKALAQEFNILLVGGDTNKGTLSISINATGLLPKDQALLRSGAKLGDVIYVSHTLGDAALAWKKIQKNETPSTQLLKRLNTPTPRVELAQHILGVANSCIDISDGLEQDLGHILQMSHMGAQISIDKIPLSDELIEYIEKTKDWCLPLAGGDDYELCFTVAQDRVEKVKEIEKKLGIALTKIGNINAESKLKIVGLSDQDCQSYQHF